MINNMISISLDGKPCVSEAYSLLCIYNSINLILVRVERKSLIRKTLILIRVPFVSDVFLDLVVERLLVSPHLDPFGLGVTVGHVFLEQPLLMIEPQESAGVAEDISLERGLLPCHR